ncbi:unnamed protein product [Clonostachys rosea f. rosea IK726]|uniref:O-methyltransferase domain-containing protein n=2 Tax=Bionectria ochroleuca TaxID=29856 RepID=A0A0B7KAF5_BIOOC|nr:unnamed protein product [Clonostachys rosea f. rosea IK726]
MASTTESKGPGPYVTPKEQDLRPGAVDDYVNSHLQTPASNKYHDALEHIREKSIAAGLPDIACSAAQAKYLAIQVKIAKAKNILELGTLGGFSAAWMASAGPDVKVTTVELEEHNANVASKNIAEAGLQNQIEIKRGAGLDVLPKLVAEVQSGQRPEFDFIFIDADKQNNLAYLNLALLASRPGTVVIVDNVVRQGRIAYLEEAAKDERISATRNLIETIGKDERLDATVIQTVGEKQYDGFLFAIKK